MASCIMLSKTRQMVQPERSMPLLIAEICLVKKPAELLPILI
jgi:hypothetical protein